MVSSLSVLEMFMLVALFRITRRGQDACSFEGVWEEYNRLAQAEGSADRCNKTAALRAFERLLGACLVKYVDPRCVYTSLYSFVGMVRLITSPASCLIIS